MNTIKTKVAAHAIAVIATVCSAGSAAADTVIADDLIVIGGACIGLDCNDGQVFGPHELILAENNLRIAFGAAGQFRLAANESRNNGAQEFRIDAFRPLTSVADAPARVAGGISLEAPASAEQPDGSIHVSLDTAPGSFSLISSPATDGTLTYTPGQTAVLPAGSWTRIGSSDFISVAASSPVTSTAPSGGFSAQITDGFVSLVSFNDAGNMVTLGIDSEQVAGAVSVGNATSLRRVTGVADAVAADDAINMGQLNSYVLNPVPDLTGRIQSETERLNGVSATTAAMSALQPNPRAEAPLSLSLGLGTYEGETAAAMGVLWQMSNTSHFQFSVAGSDASAPQTAFSIRIVW
ncbi:YadA C-terminal domain-containing protein [Gymnodinialimonas sp. 57CJ19]|uniref:YadA C-terminal domain-containing protein n=1 Tax=Gymnodinialimonas sp. 57CJ19 TaxID=3138498 RepID=UPI0031344628